jgi:hypothetical protein
LSIGDHAIADFNQALKLEMSLAGARQGRERMQVVAQNLGRSDTRVVEKYYGHLAPSYRKQETQGGCRGSRCASMTVLCRWGAEQVA